MRSIDEIIREYGQLINTDNSEFETLIKNAMLEVTEAFVEFYGEDSREELEEKFSRIKISFMPLDIHYVFECVLFSQLNKYMKQRFPNEYETIFPSNIGTSTSTINKSQEYINTLDEIIRKIAPYQEMDRRYSELKKILEHKVREELAAELNAFVRQKLIDELHYTEEMANKNQYALVNDSGITENFRRFATGEFYNINSCNELLAAIHNLRRLGINIPKLSNEIELLFAVDEATFLKAKDEFNSIINDPNISRYIPSQSMAKEILKKYKYLMGKMPTKVDNELVKQFYGTTYDFSDYLGVDQLVVRSDDCCAYALSALINSPNKRTIGGILFFNKLCFELSTFGELLIHEVNHILETTVIDNGATYILKSGWQKILARDSISHEFVEDDNVNEFSLDLLNECINQLITRDILNIIRKKTNNIAFKNITECTYEEAFFVVEQFYQLYKPEIIESRKNHNMEVLYQKIGRENFEALSELMRKVSVKLYKGEFSYERAIQNLEAGIENEETKFLVDVMEQRDQILNNMKKHSEVSRKNKGNITINNIIIILIFSLIMLYTIILIIN